MTHDEIMGLHKKTTQGEWTVEDPMGPDIISIVADGHRAVYEWKHVAQLSTADAEEAEEDGEDIPMAEQRANAAFIAAAHKAVPEMAATIDRLTRERDEARADRSQLLAAAMTMKQFASESDLAACTTAFGIFMRRAAAIEHCSAIIRASLSPPEQGHPSGDRP